MSDWDQRLWDLIHGEKPDSAWEVIYEWVNEVLSQPRRKFGQLVPEHERADVAQECMESFVRNDLLNQLRGHHGEPGQLKWLIAKEAMNVIQDWRRHRGREPKFDSLTLDEILRLDSGE